MLLVHISLYNLEYISFYKILEKDVNKENGPVVRSLSPFLWTGLIIAYFSLSGNTPDKRNLLQI
jgi:hypothetical protein